MQMGQKYGNGFGSSPSIPVLIEIPNFVILIWKIVRHHDVVPRHDTGHPNAHTDGYTDTSGPTKKRALAIEFEPS